jgi:hypothetical protein
MATKKKPAKTNRKTLWEKSIASFTMVGPKDNPNIREIKSEEGLSPKLIAALQKAKIASTKIIYAKTNTIYHTMFAVFATSRSKLPSLYIVMGAVVGINYTYLNLIGISPEGKRVNKKQLVGD